MEIKSELDKLGPSVYSALRPLGFTKLETSSDWLGFTINKKEGDRLTLVGFSLTKENPLTFELIARKWQVANPTQTCTNLYQKSFASLKELVDNPNVALAALKENLEDVL